MIMGNKNKRDNLAKSDFCRRYLHINGFLTDSENEKVFQRIRKYQDKYKVGITDAQIWSVEMTYNDNAKYEE